MLDLIFTAKLRILVLERVMTVRTRGHDLPYFAASESGDIGLSAFLKKKLIANPARGIAGTGLFFPENRKVNPGFAQQFRRGPGDLLRPWIEGGGATDPEEIFKVRIGFDRRNVQSFRPGKALNVR